MKKTVTTIKKYDAEGKLVEETVTEITESNEITPQVLKSATYVSYIWSVHKITCSVEDLNDL